MFKVISNKKYQKLQDELESQSEEITRLKAKNYALETSLSELRNFSKKFKEFYDHMTNIPPVFRQDSPSITISASRKLENYDYSSSRVALLKEDLLSDLVRQITRNDILKFELVDDPYGNTIYRCQITMIKK